MIPLVEYELFVLGHKKDTAHYKKQDNNLYDVSLICLYCAKRIASTQKNQFFLNMNYKVLFIF